MVTVDKNEAHLQGQGQPWTGNGTFPVGRLHGNPNFSTSAMLNKAFMALFGEFDSQWY